MIAITTFDPEFRILLPGTCTLLMGANLIVHDDVEQVFIEGSRGLAGGYRTDSDVDLTLMVARHILPKYEPDREQFLRNILDTTLGHWREAVKADLAAVFDTGECCGLRCFQTRYYDPEIVRDRGIDCFGVYKIQRGFNGYVRHGIELARMYPMLRIWRNVVCDEGGKAKTGG